MKRKIISSVLILVLLLSFNLFSVTPAAAVTTDADIEAATLTASDRLVTTQNNDGGWEWDNPDDDPATGTPSPYNTLGVTAQGVLDTYQITQDPLDLAVCVATFDRMQANSLDGDPAVHRIRGPDIPFLVELSETTDTGLYAEFAKARWEAAKTEFTDNGTATQFAEYIRSVREPSWPALVAWDINLYIQGALALDRYFPGQGYDAEATEMAEVIYNWLYVDDPGFDFEDTEMDEYWISFTGAIEAFVTTGTHGNKVDDLLDELLGSQEAEGNFIGVGEGWDTQTTAYAVMAILKVGETAAAKAGVEYLEGAQFGNGGIGDEDENTEVTSEMTQAIYDFIQATGKVDLDRGDDGTVDVTTLTIQLAINSANDGDAIDVGPGEYAEDITLDKQLILDGAGSGDDPATDSIISPADAFTNFTIAAGGESPTDRLVVRDFYLSGQGHKDGFRMMGPGTISYVTLENVAAEHYEHGAQLLGNDDDPLTVNDLEVISSRFSNNDQKGFAIGANNYKNVTVNGVKFIDCDMDDNFEADLYIWSMADTVTDLEITRGSYTGSGQFGDIAILGGLNGATITDVTAGDSEASAILFYTYAPVSDVAIVNPTIADVPGSSGIAFFNDEGGSIAEVSVSGGSISNCAKGVSTYPGTTLVSIEGVDFANNGVQVNDGAETLNIADVLANNTFDRSVVVDHEGSLLYTIWSSIQDGIDATVDNDTVSVGVGNYNEQLAVTTSITLLGAQANVEPRALVDGVPSGDLRTGGESVITNAYALNIRANDVTVNGFKFVDFRYGINTQTEPGVVRENITLEYNILLSDKAWVGILTGEGYTPGCGGDGQFDNILITHNSVDVSASASDDPYALSAVSFTGATGYFDFVTFNDVKVSYNYLRNPDERTGIFCGAATDAFRFNSPVIESNYFYLCVVGINVGNMYDATVTTNLFEDNPYCGAQIGVLGGEVTDNIFKHNYPSPYEDKPSYNLMFWGTQWGFPNGSRDATVTGNSFDFNNYESSTEPDNGVRVLEGCLADTIKINRNDFTDGGVMPDAKAMVNEGQGVLDATDNWWGQESGPRAVSKWVKYRPWLPVPKDETAEPTEEKQEDYGQKSEEFEGTDTTVDTTDTEGSGDITVTSTNYDPPEDAGTTLQAGTGKQALKYVDVKIENNTYHGDIRITISYTDEDLDRMGVNEYDLTLYYYDMDADEWVEAANVIVDMDNNTISGDIPADKFAGLPIACGGDPLTAIENLDKHIFYDTIQLAVDDADPGNTIALDDGTYNVFGGETFPVVVDVPDLNILSLDGPVDTIIQPSSDNACAFEVTAPGVTIGGSETGFTINSGGIAGIYADEAGGKGIKVLGNIFVSYADGESRAMVFEKLWGDAQVEENTFAAPRVGTGILIQNADGASISRNNVPPGSVKYAFVTFKAEAFYPDRDPGHPFAEYVAETPSTIDNVFIQYNALNNMQWAIRFAASTKHADHGEPQAQDLTVGSAGVQLLGNRIADNGNGVRVDGDTVAPDDLDQIAHIIGAANIQLHGNAFQGNDGAVNNGQVAAVQAQGNWWSSVAGPDVATNPYVDQTSGEQIIGNADYTPWMIQFDLDTGWNIISWPIMGAETAETDIPDTIIAAYYFDSETQLWGANPFDAGPMDAMYIKTTAPVTIGYVISDEATFPSQKDMKVGWNFIGLAELYPVPVDEALLDIYFGTGEVKVGYSKVICPSLNGESWTYLTDGANPPDLLPTMGYWVFMVNDGVLGGRTTTPIVQTEP